MASLSPACHSSLEESRGVTNKEVKYCKKFREVQKNIIFIDSYSLVPEGHKSRTHVSTVISKYINEVKDDVSSK